jgi:ankyrin repeat protein
LRTLITLVTVVGAGLLLLFSCGKIGVDRLDEHGMTSLMRAARAGNRAEVVRLISRGSDVNRKVPSRDLRELIAFINWMQQLPESDIGYTPLFYAAQAGHPDIVALLLDHGADVHHTARLGETPLDLAIWRSDLKVMELLVAAGARCDPRQFGTAVRHSTPEAVRFLLEHGADPNAAPGRPRRSSHRFPAPVILAVQRGDPAVLKLLIDAGAHLNVQDQNGWTALRWANQSTSRRRDERSKAIIALLEGTGVQDKAGRDAAELFKAVMAKDPARVRDALSAGADPNAKDDRGVPPLIYAGRMAQADVVRLLVAAGADVNASPEYDTTPLISAVTGGSIEAVKILLTAGARIDQQDRLHRTPLAEASSWKRVEITRLLLDTSANVDPGALAIAALSGSLEQVRMLLASGANPNAGDGHVLSEATRGCFRRDNTDVIRLLLEAGASPKPTSKDEYTALHRAAGLCPPEVLRLLLQRGAEINARDLSGNTPLISAASSGKLDNVQLLIDRGAEVNARNGDGKSALDHATYYPEVQRVLLQAGAR